MRYYLRTLEGVGRCFGGVLYDEFLRRFETLLNAGNSRKLSTYGALKQMRSMSSFKDADFSEIYAVIDDKYKGDPYNYREVFEGKEAFIIDESRKRQKAQAQEAAQEQARAIAEAQEAQARAEMEAERAAALKFEQEEAAAQAAAEIAKYEALRDEIATNLNYIENGQMILTTPEAMQVYKELTGRDYSEILARDEEAAAVYESEVKKMNEQKIDIGPVVVSSEHEYTIIDEDENTITYQDETGAVYVEQKAKSALPWLIAGAAALFLLA